jgi:hypothetical protein
VLFSTYKQRIRKGEYAMIKYFGEYAIINTLEKELSEVESQISACYDFWNQESVPVDLIERSNTLEKELATLKRNRTKGGLVCRCM